MDDLPPVTGRERLDFLFDAPSWRARHEARWGCAGEGQVFGRRAIALAFSQGIEEALDAAFPAAISDLAAQARLEAVPLVLLLDHHLLKGDAATYARFHETLTAVAACHGQAVIAAMLGSLTGPAAILARSADILCALPHTRLSLADEAVARLVGPAEQDSAATADFLAANEAAVLHGVRRFVTLLSANEAPADAEGPFDEPDDAALGRLIGADLDAGFDVRRLLRRIVDPDGFVELGNDDGLVAAIARIGGRTVGLLCCDSSAKSGALGTAALRRAIRMLTFCERLNLPLVTVLDSPGVIPEAGALDALAALGRCWSGTQLSVVSLTMRRAIGGAGFALQPPAAVNRRRLHWPPARLGFARALATEPQGTPITPAETRRMLIATLREIAESQS